MRWQNRQSKKIKKIKTTLPTFTIASVASRFKAFIIDSFLLLMPILYIVFYVILGSREGFRDNMMAGWFLVLIPHFLITTLFLYYKTQTPGYKAYNIALIDTLTLKPASFMRLFFRYILFLITIISIGVLFAPLLRKDKAAVYDILSRTALIENPQST